MKCPKCGQELKPSKKDPDYMLCFDCKKKYRIPAQAEKKQDRKPQRKSRDEEEQHYSNIPPKSVRDKREKEMRKAYGDLLSVEESSQRRKKVRREELDDDFDYDYEDEKVSKVPIIILGIAILVVAGLIIYMLLK